MTRITLEGSTGLECYPKCLSSISNFINGDLSVCPDTQDIAMCALIASIIGFDNADSLFWSCTPQGLLESDPCDVVNFGYTPWFGVTCNTDNSGVIEHIFLGPTSLPGKSTSTLILDIFTITVVIVMLIIVIYIAFVLTSTYFYSFLVSYRYNPKCTGSAGPVDITFCGGSKYLRYISCILYIVSYILYPICCIYNHRYS